MLIGENAHGFDTLRGTAPPSLIDSPKLKELATDPYWLNLLAYEDMAFHPGSKGMVKTPGFYLHEEGDEDPLAELKATIHALFAPPIQGAEDAHAACLFPARRRFLFVELDLLHYSVELPNPDCQAYQAWRKRIDTQRIALVYADAYMGNPASMFGHTLLRMDRKDDLDRPLTSFALNHAAQTGEDHGIIFAMRGILGGYLGAYNIMPYYEKVKEYNRLDKRDLWEYELDLNDRQINRLLAHLWELDGAGLPYYFFYQNCSFRLMQLLEVADPQLELTNRFKLWAIPADTVRAVAKQPDLVKAVNYRPSGAHKLDYAFEQLDSRQDELARSLATGVTDIDAEAISELSEQRRAHTLEAAYYYLDHLANNQELGEQARSRRYQLLLARSRIHASRLDDPPRPETTPDEGHPTGRSGFGVGEINGVNFTELHWRTSYHDLMDPPQGYLPGAQISMLDISARYYDDDTPKHGQEPNGGLELEHLHLVEVRSINARNQPLPGITWGTRLGAERHYNKQGERPLAGTIDGEVGHSWRFGATGKASETSETGKAGRTGRGWIILSGTTSLRGSTQFADGYRAGIGGLLEIIYTHPILRSSISAYGVQFHDHEDSWRLTTAVGISLGEDLALRLNLGKEEDLGVRTNDIELLIDYYY